jgi:N-sulfoglucosamine sulfohydrolase
MTRRELLSASAAPAFLQRTSARQRPNILYLHSHDTGRYIQPYGHAVPAPNLQKFASEAVLFRQAFDAAPTCSPSRAALLTGMAPHSNGMFGLAHRGFRLNDPRQHLANVLRGEGYLTALSGVQHVTTADLVPTLGYERVLPAKSNHGPDATRAAVDFLNAKPTEPFFLACGYIETHREFPVPGPKEDPRYTLPPAPLPDTPQTRADMAAFKASARVLDESMGGVLEALARNGFAENTLVVLTTDHGIAFPRMKCNLNAHGMGVMLMMRGPGGFGGGRVCDALVSHIDLFPTICEVTGIQPPAWLQGRSLLPLIRGEKDEIRDHLFGEINYHAAYEPARSIRTKRWNYVRRYGSRTRPVLPNCDDGPSKTVWVDAGWRGQPVESEQFFDLIFDPAESRNLAQSPAHQGEVEKLRATLETWMRDTSDPLLHGDVPAPAGARVNDPDGLSPREPVRALG